MKSVLIYISVLLISVSAQARDLGVKDTLGFDVTITPVEGEKISRVQLDLYIWVDSNTKISSMSPGFAWDNPRLQMDSARVSDLSDYLFNYIFLFDSQCIDTTNRNRRFLFVGISFRKRLPATSKRQYLASYFFTAKKLIPNEVIKIDTCAWYPGAKYIVDDAREGNTLPVWKPVYLFDTASYRSRDWDNDAIPNEVDNAPEIPNYDQQDIDEDDIGDVADSCIDLDQDGYGDPEYKQNTCPPDNCPKIFNEDQLDKDNDGIGDVCDNCPNDYNPFQEDVDEDNIGDKCDSLTDFNRKKRTFPKEEYTGPVPQISSYYCESEEAFLYYYSRRRKPSGYLKFNILDGDELFPMRATDIKIQSLSEKLDHSRLNRKMNIWHPSWLPPGYYRVEMSFLRYDTLIFDSLRITKDSMLFVNIFMRRGNDRIHLTKSDSDYYSIDSFDISDKIPEGCIFGKIYDQAMNQPVKGAMIYCRNYDLYTETTEDGSYRIENQLGDTAIYLDIWRPDYDSIYLKINKRYDFSDKEVDIHFEKQRKDIGVFNILSPPEILFVIVRYEWGSFIVSITDNKLSVYVCKVTEGDSFDTSYRGYGLNKEQFKLLKISSPKEVTIQFTKFLTTANMDENLLTATVTDKFTSFHTRTLDGGSTFSLKIIPQ